MQTMPAQLDGPGRVLLVDDHPAVRRVLRSLLEEVGGWQVVGEAESGEAALPLVEQLVPDVVLMDCRMPGQGGVATTREIVRRWPKGRGLVGYLLFWVAYAVVHNYGGSKAFANSQLMVFGPGLLPIIADMLWFVTGSAAVLLAIRLVGGPSEADR